MITLAGRRRRIPSPVYVRTLPYLYEESIVASQTDIKTLELMVARTPASGKLPDPVIREATRQARESIVAA